MHFLASALSRCYCYKYPAFDCYSSSSKDGVEEALVDSPWETWRSTIWTRTTRARQTYEPRKQDKTTPVFVGGIS